MDCRDFEENIDRYVDAEMPDGQMASAAEHVQACNSCHSLATNHQYASALLRSTVADKAAAVDLTGLWQSIESRLDEEGGLAPAARPRRRMVEQSSDDVSLLGRLVAGLFGPSPFRAGAFAAAAAALAFMLFGGFEIPGVGSFQEKIAKAVSGGSAAPAEQRGKAVRIDTMEVAQGRTVAVWARPKTRTQVIWVNSLDESSNGAFGVSNTAAKGR